MALAEAETALPQSAQARQISPPRATRREWPGLLCLVLLSVAIRSPGIARPLVGNFATKNATYAMIARNWALGRAPFWRPTTDCMAGGDRGWHLLEVPVAAYLTGAGWAVCGGSLEVWGRGTSIAFSAASVVLMYLLVRRWHGRAAAYVAALALALSPVSIIFGQSFMLEASVVCLTLATLLAFDVWLEQRRGFGVQGSGFSDLKTTGLLIIAWMSFALLLLTKIYMVVLLLPLLAMTWRSAIGRKKVMTGAVAMALAVIPAAVWCIAVLRTAMPDSAQSARVFDSLYRSTTVHHWPHPLLTSGAFYARLLYNLIMPGLTPLAALLAFIGLASSTGRRHVAWLGAMALLVVALPAKFYELQYYTLIVVPAMSVLAGVGWKCLRQRWHFPRSAIIACVLAWAAVSMRLSIGPAFATPDEDRAVTAAGAVAHSLVAPNEPVVTLHGASSDLLYYCDRRGWALSTNDRGLMQKLEQYRRQGARWLVAADLKSLAASPCADELTALPVACEGDDYRVFRLSRIMLQRSTAQNGVHPGSPTRK